METADMIKNQNITENEINTNLTFVGANDRSVSSYM